MTPTSQPELHSVQKIGRALAFVFSLIIIAVIAFFVLDEANARFGVLAISVVIVAMTRPVAIYTRLGRTGWLVDIGLVAAFLYSAIWFFRVK